MLGELDVSLSLFFSLEKPWALGGLLSARCADHGEGQCSLSVAVPLTFLMWSFSVSVAQGLASATP